MGPPTSPPRILVIGSLSIDFVSRVPHHPQPGETLTASSFALSPGGKGANQATAVAKLSRPRPSPAFVPPTTMSDGNYRHGAKEESATVLMSGAVGQDAYGPVLRASLASSGVDTSLLRARAGAKTGVAIIVVDEGTGENRIVLSPEANATVGKDEFCGDLSSSSPSSGQEENGGGKPDLLIMQLEIPLSTVVAALETAQKQGIPVLFNPAPARMDVPAEVYAGLAHLVVNETEAVMLAGLGDAISVLDDLAGLEKTADSFKLMGTKNVIITLGGRGVYYQAEDGSKGMVPAEKASVVDTTAAGDTFVGSYALDVVAAAREGRRFDVGNAVRKANKASKITVERHGAQASIPWRDELVL